jgi:hypothetical protein
MKRSGKVAWCASVVAVALGGALAVGYFIVREKVSTQPGVVKFAGLRFSARNKNDQPHDVPVGTFVSSPKFTRGAWITCGDVIFAVSYGKDFGSR